MRDESCKGRGVSKGELSHYFLGGALVSVAMPGRLANTYTQLRLRDTEFRFVGNPSDLRLPTSSRAELFDYTYIDQKAGKRIFIFLVNRQKEE